MIACEYCHTAICDHVIAGDSDGYLFHIDCARLFYIAYEKTVFRPYIVFDNSGEIIDDFMDMVNFE